MLSHLISPGDGRRCRLPVFLLPFVVLVGACDTEPARVDPASPTATETTELAVAQDKALDPNRFMAIERIFARIWNRVPAFSGFWYDDLGRLVIGVTDLSRAPDVEAVLEQNAPSYFYDHRGARRSTEAVTGAYDFKTMIEWKHQARSRMGRLGFHSLDYAEDRNEILAKVENEGDRQAVREALRGVGIPDDQIRVKTAPRPELTATIDDEVSPVVGGLRIERGSDGNNCTLGFTAIDSTSGSAVFVTNAHCTDNGGSDDNTTFYQPATGTGQWIGTEFRDPAPEPCADSSDDCRYSDAALIKFPDGFVEENAADDVVDGDWERAIANIDESTGVCDDIDNSAHDITIDASQPRLLNMLGTRDFQDSWADPPAYGEIVQHLGENTGQTETTVVNTDVDTSAPTAGFFVLDQTRSECDDCVETVESGGGKTQTTVDPRVSDNGDSGGPVYRLGLHPCTDPVRIDGVRWGTNDHSDVIWSPIDGIEADLGLLRLQDETIAF